MKKVFLFCICSLLFWGIASVTVAQQYTYQPLSNITDPQGGPLLDGASTLPLTFTRLYQLGIGVVFTFAFLSFLYAGWQYIGSDVITDKAKGKTRLKETMYGVLIALTGFVLLNTINPNILAFQDLDLSLKNPTGNTSFLSTLWQNSPVVQGGGVLGQAGEALADNVLTPMLQNVSGAISLQNATTSMRLRNATSSSGGPIGVIVGATIGEIEQGKQIVSIEGYTVTNIDTFNSALRQACSNPDNIVVQEGTNNRRCEVDVRMADSGVLFNRSKKLSLLLNATGLQQDQINQQQQANQQSSTPEIEIPEDEDGSESLQLREEPEE